MENQEVIKAVAESFAAAVKPLYESVETLMNESNERKQEIEKKKKEPEQTPMSKGVEQYINAQKSDSNLKGKEV